MQHINKICRWFLVMLTFSLCMFNSCRRHVPSPGAEPKVNSPRTSTSTPVRVQPKTYSLTLYFQDSKGPWLSPETRIVRATTEKELGQRIVEALIEGPSSSKLLPTLPQDTALLNLVFDRKHKWILVNFDAHLSTNHPGGSEAEILTVYSLVNSLLANLPDFKRVWILIDNHSRQVLKSHVYIGRPLPKNLSWVVTPAPS